MATRSNGRKGRTDVRPGGSREKPAVVWSSDGECEAWEVLPKKNVVCPLGCMSSGCEEVIETEIT